MTDIASTYLSRTLQENGSGGDRALALKVFSGTVLEAFRAKCVFYDNTGSIMVKKNLTGGHMAQWPVIGDDIDLYSLGTFTDSGGNNDYSDSGDVATDGGLALGYHTAGEFIKGRKIKMSEQTVRVDDVLVSAIDVPFQDLDLSHFDVIRPFATKLGRSLAIDNDKKIATIAMKAATDPGLAGVYPGGQEVYIEGHSETTVAGNIPDSTIGSARFRNAAAELAEAFDNDHVPEEGRYLFISPLIRRVLRHETDVFNRDYNPDAIAGDLNSRTIGMLEGFNLVVTTHMPGNYGVTDTMFKYMGGNEAHRKYDFKVTGADEDTAVPAAIALCGAQEGSAAIGMVQAAGIRTVIEDDERRNVKFMKAQMMVGYDIVSPWCAGVIGCYS